jgi:hypothetical protein
MPALSIEENVDPVRFREQVSMAIVNGPTPPQELFRDLADLTSLVFSFLTRPQVVVRRWPAYYMVYVEIDGLCRDISRTTCYLSQGFTEPDGVVGSVRIEGVNACLARVDRHVRTIMDLLGRMEQHRLIDHGNSVLTGVIRAHFSPERGWYQACQKQYRAGRVSPDGQVLERTILLLDPYSSLGAEDLENNNPVQRQTFELVSEQSRVVLGRTARQVQVKMNQVYAALGNFFVDHCPSVKDLLHPSML